MTGSIFLLAALPGLAAAASLANWDFENGDLSASSTGNFVTASHEVVDLGTTSFAASSGFGGGGALRFDEPSQGISNSVLLFTIANIHPTDPLFIEEATMLIGGTPGEVYTIWERRNGGLLFEIDDGVQSNGPWTGFTYPPGFGTGLEIPAGETFSFGWSNVGQSGNTHFFDNISFSGTEPVPEPSAGLLLGIGAFLIGRRRRK